MANEKSPQGQRKLNATTKPRGQRVSRARGSATNHKKNPGKRAHQGGS